MNIDRSWALRNLGFDPTTTALPSNTFALPSKANSTASVDVQREIIDFDSEAQHGLRFLAYSTATGMSRYQDPAWPSALAPNPSERLAPRSADPLPRADILIVTWTVDEGHALSRVLTPGKDSRDDYIRYTHRYDRISSRMRAGCPARELKRLGTYWTATIGAKSLVIFKSDSHLSQDGPSLPNIDVWTQIIDEVRPSLVITTGTASGIGGEFEVGDVLVSPAVRFDCKAKFKNEPFAAAAFRSDVARATHFQTARTLLRTNAGQLPKDNTRPPKIFRTAPSQLTSSVVTTDFFGFDTSDDHYALQGLGHASEMGDAVLGLVCSRMGDTARRWVAVRNVSDPQIRSSGLTLAQQTALAVQTYKAFGRWSSVCSAIVCWALAAAEN